MFGLFSNFIYANVHAEKTTGFKVISSAKILCALTKLHHLLCLDKSIYKTFPFQTHLTFPLAHISSCGNFLSLFYFYIIIRHVLPASLKSSSDVALKHANLCSQNFSSSLQPFRTQDTYRLMPN